MKHLLMVSCVVDFSVLVRQSDLLYESVRAGSNQVKLPSAKVCSADQCGCAPPVTEQKTMFSLCYTQMLYMFFLITTGQHSSVLQCFISSTLGFNSGRDPLRFSVATWWLWFDIQKCTNLMQINTTPFTCSCSGFFFICSCIL